MRKRILINGKFKDAQVTGVQRIGVELSAALLKVLARDGVEIECKCSQPGRLTGFANAYTRTLWEQIILPMTSMEGFLVNLCNSAPIFKRNQLVMLADTAVFDMPENFSKKVIIWYGLMFRQIARNSKKVVTISNFSRERLSACLGIPEELISVVYLGCDHMESIEADSAILDRLGVRGEQFILGVGSLQPRKNFKALLSAFSTILDPNFKLVIAGGSNDMFLRGDSQQFSRNVLYAGYVTDEELKALYQAASCFVYPSLYEGFGLPPLEAMSCACPVICSDVGSLPEVCGDAVIYCDPHSVASIAAKIRLVMSDDVLRTSMSVHGKDYAKSYSWNRSAEQLAEIIAAT